MTAIGDKKRPQNDKFRMKRADKSPPHLIFADPDWSTWYFSARRNDAHIRCDRPAEKMRFSAHPLRTRLCIARRSVKDHWALLLSSTAWRAKTRRKIRIKRSFLSASVIIETFSHQNHSLALCKSSQWLQPQCADVGFYTTAHSKKSRAFTRWHRKKVKRKISCVTKSKMIFQTKKVLRRHEFFGLIGLCR